MEAQWVQFAAHGFKRKRAELACAFCHSKKIRCDLQVKRNEGDDSCTNCSTAGRDCWYVRSLPLTSIDAFS